MKLALIGHGAMNRLVEQLAAGAGFTVAAVITSDEAALGAPELAERKLGGVDVAIDFSLAAAVRRNVEACLLAGVPLVEGTTGWQTEEAEVRRLLEERGGALVYGSNFSIGVNLFYRIVAEAARLLRAAENYTPFIEEAHHERKRDAPSGTAMTLRELVAAQFDAGQLSVASTRAGHIPGTHRVGFDSPADQILLVHEARSREGFASGALRAAHWISGRRGVYQFSEVLDEIFGKGRDEAK